MSSLMTSPSSSAPASAWSVNQVKKLSGSSCCLFLPALFCVWLERLVRSCKHRRIMYDWLPTWKHWSELESCSLLVFYFYFLIQPRHRKRSPKVTKKKKSPPKFTSMKNSLSETLTFPDFHLISVDFEDGSPLSFKWNSLERTLFSKYGFSSKYYKINLLS